MIVHAKSISPVKHPARRWSLFTSVALTGLLVGGVARPAAADALADIQHRRTLVWGGDQEGGGPYVYPDPEHPEIVRGFEVDLAEMVADELHVKAVFKQGDWERLPQLLDGTIDVVLNGYELSPSRQRDYLCSRPITSMACNCSCVATARSGVGRTWRRRRAGIPCTLAH